MSAASGGAAASLIAGFARGGRPIEIPDFHKPYPMSRMGEVIEETQRRVDPALRRPPKPKEAVKRPGLQETWSAIANKSKRLTEKTLRPMFMSPLQVVENELEEEEVTEEKDMVRHCKERLIPSHAKPSIADDDERIPSAEEEAERTEEEKAGQSLVSSCTAAASFQQRTTTARGPRRQGASAGTASAQQRRPQDQVRACRRVLPLPVQAARQGRDGAVHVLVGPPPPSRYGQAEEGQNQTWRRRRRRCQSGDWCFHSQSQARQRQHHCDKGQKGYKFNLCVGFYRIHILFCTLGSTCANRRRRSPSPPPCHSKAEAEVSHEADVLRVRELRRLRRRRRLRLL